MSIATGAGGTPQTMRTAIFLLLLWLTAAPAAWADAPELEFHPPASAGDPATPAAMRDLAGRLLPVYQDPDPDRFLANLSMVQMVAGDYASASISRQTLRERRRKAATGRPAGRSLIFDMYAYARTLEAQNGLSFAEAFGKSFHETVSQLRDRDAYAVTRWLGTPVSALRDALQNTLDQERGKDQQE